MSSGEKILVEEYFRGLKEKNPIEEALNRLWLETSNTLSAVQHSAGEMAKRQKAERSEVRQLVVQRHRAAHGPDATISTSPMCVFVTAGIDALEINWSKMWRKKGSRTPSYTRVRMDIKSGHSPTTLLVGAHEEEEDMILAHEMEVRRLRGRWRDAMAIRSSVRSAMRKYLSEGAGRRGDN